MRNMPRIENVKSAKDIPVAGIICVAAAILLAASPMLAQAQSDAAQDERSGVSRPDSRPITVTPYNDDASMVESVQPVKPSAAIPKADTSASSGQRVYGSYAPDTAPRLLVRNKAVATGNSTAVKNKEATAFDPDANIVTEETAGRADRQLQSETVATAAKGDIDDGIVTRVPSRPGEVPDGTLVKVKLHEDLSSLTTKPGTSFTAEVSEAVLREGQVVVPAGSLLEGRVTWVRGGKRVGGAAAIHLEARTVTLPDGSQYLIHARVIDTDSWDDTKVDAEGTILRKDHAKGVATTMALTTGGGMAAGAVVGGLPGALIGAGVGAGVSTVVWMRQDRQADLPKDLGIVFSLTEPMRVAPLSAQMTRPVVGSGGGK